MYSSDINFPFEMSVFELFKKVNRFQNHEVTIVKEGTGKLRKFRWLERGECCPQRTGRAVAAGAGVWHGLGSWQEGTKPCGCDWTVTKGTTGIVITAALVRCLLCAVPGLIWTDVLELHNGPRNGVLR